MAAEATALDDGLSAERRLRYPLKVSVAENLGLIEERIEAAARRAGRDAASVRLVGVTKGVALAAVEAALAAGLRDLGENVVQDASERRRLSARAGEAAWHFIGHLQTNKVRPALALFDIIESVDSLRLAEGLARRATGRLPILLEVNVAQETSKFGFSPDEVADAVSAVARLPSLELRGLMTVAPEVPDAEAVRPTFRALRELARVNGLTELSMGMSNDYEVAVEEGATLVRLGRAIFGERPA